MEVLAIVLGIASIVLFVFYISWMVQILRLVHEIRILASVNAQLLARLVRVNGVDADLEQIQDEVLDSM